MFLTTLCRHGNGLERSSLNLFARTFQSRLHLSQECRNVFLRRQVESKHVQGLTCSQSRRVLVFIFSLGIVLINLLSCHNREDDLDHRDVELVLDDGLLLEASQSAQEGHSLDLQTILYLALRILGKSEA